ncbi:MAG TPA: helix-turn-helix domain-containing protein [Chthonomonadaceae bacterium]|nr:helix-turn-helix domain-containing protein [Chthonomonadaceae bacterium]
MKVLTVKEAAERLDCTPSSLYLAVQEGRLKYVRQLGRIGLRERDVEEYGKRIGQANGWVKRSQGISAPAGAADNPIDGREYGLDQTS